MLIRPGLKVPRLTNFRRFVDCLKLSLCSFVSLHGRTLVSGCMLEYLEDYYNKLFFGAVSFKTILAKKGRLRCFTER